MGDDEREVFMDCEKGCFNEYRIKQLEEDSLRNQQTHKEFFGKFEEQKVALAMQGKDIASFGSKLDEISRDVKEIKETPSKRYETIVACVITTVVGAIIGFLVSGVLPM